MVKENYSFDQCYSILKFKGKEFREHRITYRKFYKTLEQLSLRRVMGVKPVIYVQVTFLVIFVLDSLLVPLLYVYLLN